MKQFDVITLELSTAAPQKPWIMVNGWPMHCNQWAVPNIDSILPSFVCVACGDIELNCNLPSAGDDYAAQ